MAKARKDNRGRVLQKGESQRKSNLKYVYTYTDPSGTRRYISSVDLMELRQRIKILVRNQQDGLDVYLAGKATVDFLYDRYITTKTELRSTTYANYTYMYEHFVREKFGKRLVTATKYSNVLQFYLYLCNDLNLQINTVETIHTILHPAFQMAVRDEIIRINPTDGAMAEVKKKLKKTGNTRHALTIEQQRAFVNYIVNSPVFYHWAPLFIVLLGTGLRIGEALGLRWEDVDFEKRQINVNHSLTYYPRREDNETKCEFAVSLPKTEAGVRSVPMVDEVYDALSEEYERQLEYGFNVTAIDGMKGFIFMNRFGNVHNPMAVNRAIKRIIHSHNAEEEVAARKRKQTPIIIPNFSCHHLRHTFCTRLCENVKDIKAIQVIMGHADIQTTLNIYAEATDTMKKDAMSNLPKLNIF